MVTYGGMAKQPVIASVVSWWGRQAWRWPQIPQLSQRRQCPCHWGRTVHLKWYLKFLPSEPVCPSCIRRACSFLRISNFGAFGCPSGRTITVEVSGWWHHCQGLHKRPVPTVEVTSYSEPEEVIRPPSPQQGERKQPLTLASL